MADDVYDNSGLPSPASAWQAGDGVPIPGPEGPQGPTGPAPNLDIGTVVQGTTAQATITGANPNYLLNLVLPQGPTGNSGNPGGNASLTIGTVTSGSPADASITGTPPNQRLNLVLPQGTAGVQGPPGTSSFIRLGNGAPANSIGNATDVYIDLTTGNMYGPKDATTGWGPVVGNFKGIPDAPADGKMYVRKDNAWVELPVTP